MNQVGHMMSWEDEESNPAPDKSLIEMSSIDGNSHEVLIPNGLPPPEVDEGVCKCVNQLLIGGSCSPIEKQTLKLLLDQATQKLNEPIEIIHDENSL